MSADAAMGLIAAMKGGHARVDLHSPRASISSSSSSSVATAPQTPSPPSAGPSSAETSPPPTDHTPAYTLIGLAVANDPVLRAKIDALPAVLRPALAGPAALKPCSGEELTYAEVMRLAGPVVRKEKGEEAGKKGRRSLFACLRGRM